MAILLDVVKDGITISQDFSCRFNDIIYKNGVISSIDIKILKSTILDYLKTTDCGIHQINIKEFNGFPTQSIYGLVTVSNKVAEIVVNGKLNHCWQRFTVIKELVQLYIDSSGSKEAYAHSDIITQIQELVKLQEKALEFNSYNGEQVSEKEYTEISAVVMAIDLPFPLKQKYEGFVASLFILLNSTPKVVSHYDIAAIIKIPEFIVKTYFDSFHAISSEMGKHYINQK